MNGRIKDLYLLIIYLLAITSIIILIVSGVEAILITLFYSLCWLFSFSIRNLLIYNTDHYRKWAFITYLLEILLIMYLGAMGAGGAVTLLLYLTFADCCIIWGKGYGVACYVLILLAVPFKQVGTFEIGANAILLTVFKEVPLLTLVAIVSYLVGSVLKNSVILESSMEDVQEREAKLRIAYKQLEDAYKSLEEMATLKERNRIARDIHDTVGHTLTTVIVELEAGRMLLEKDPIFSKKKYEMAQEQAVKALNDMRWSVRMLREEAENRFLKQAIEDVLEETSIHTDVAVRYIIDLPEGTKTPYDDLLVRALKEGLSNGIRHGKATAFFFKLYMEDKKLYFLLQDNGMGCDNMVYGFGLESMKKGVEQAGGIVSFSTANEEGFDIEIRLPVKGEGV